MVGHLFAYGSLVDPASTQATLGRLLAPDDAPRPAILHGYRRAWNTASGPHSHPQRHLVLADGTPYAGVLAVLGLEPDDDAACPGAVLRISADDLHRLLDRERNYHLADVTDRVRHEGRPLDGPVHTFVPRPESVRLLRTAPRAAVRRSYLHLVERAFDRLGRGQLTAFRATTAPTALPTLDVQIIEA